MSFLYLLLLRASQQLAVSKDLLESAAIRMDTFSRLYAKTAKPLHKKPYTKQGCSWTQHACLAISCWAYVPDPMREKRFQ